MPTITFDLSPIPPFRLDLTVWAIRRRADNTIDRWDGATYLRVLALSAGPAVVEVTRDGPPRAPRLVVRVSGERLGSDAEAEATRALERLLGGHADLTTFYDLAARDHRLGPLAGRFRGLKPPRFPTAFEALVNAIACQQITLTLGIRLLGKLAETYGPSAPIFPSPRRGEEASGQEGDTGESPHEIPAPGIAVAVSPTLASGAVGMIYALPGPADVVDLTAEELRQISFSRQKTRALVEAGRAVVAGQLDLDGLDRVDDATAVARLRELPGVGRWTAEYALLRGLGRLNVFPGDDVGARNNLQRWLDLPAPLDYEGIQQIVADWQPYAGLVYFHLLLDRLAEKGFVAPSL